MKRDQMLDLFEKQYGSRSAWWIQAPGRVNILGEHTDYNDGFVFPAAIDRFLRIAASPRQDGRVRAYSVDFGQASEFSVDSIVRSEEASWSNYIRGVFDQFQKRGLRPSGADMVLSGDVPVGAGLSSSAALEVAVSEMIRAIDGFPITKVEQALLSQAAERQFVGVQCGIMDQFVSTLAQAGTALFIDCRDLSYSAVPMRKDVAVVVCDSRVQRRLDSSAYNQRRSECEKAVELMGPKNPGIKALRDVSPADLEACRGLLPEVVYRRARHVVGENHRVLEGIKLLEKGAVEEFGALLYQSHTSLRDDYEVSCVELDTLVELAREVEGTVGARMTGAGFGGCTVNLVAVDRVEPFKVHVKAGYLQQTGRDCEIYSCVPSGGAFSESLV